MVRIYRRGGSDRAHASDRAGLRAFGGAAREADSVLSVGL